MIEQEMIFALGFLTAALLALACLPAVWRRAMRLTSRRLARLVPLSMDEIVAERDGLRAGFAVEQRRLEQKADAAEARRSDLMARLGRRDATLAAREDALAAAAAHIAQVTGELHDTTRELCDVRAGTGTAAVALHDLTGLAERRLWEVLAAREEAAALRSVIDAHRAKIASLEMHIVERDFRTAELDRALDHVRAELARTVQATIRAAAERDAAVAAGGLWRAERDELARRVAVLEGEADERERQVATLKLAPPTQGATIEASGAASPDAELAVLRETLRRVADDVLRFTEAQTPQ